MRTPRRHLRCGVSSFWTLAILYGNAVEWSLVWPPGMKVVALPEFLTRARWLLSEAERGEFADYIGANPESGKVIPGLKGVRKVRWGRGTTGKRGGVRIIYLYLVVRET